MCLDRDIDRVEQVEGGKGGVPRAIEDESRDPSLLAAIVGILPGLRIVFSYDQGRQAALCQAHHQRKDELFAVARWQDACMVDRPFILPALVAQDGIDQNRPAKQTLPDIERRRGIGRPRHGHVALDQLAVQ